MISLCRSGRGGRLDASAGRVVSGGRCLQCVFSDAPPRPCLVSHCENWANESKYPLYREFPSETATHGPDDNTLCSDAAARHACQATFNVRAHRSATEPVGRDACQACDFLRHSQGPKVCRRRSSARPSAVMSSITTDRGSAVSAGRDFDPAFCRRIHFFAFSAPVKETSSGLRMLSGKTACSMLRRKATCAMDSALSASVKPSTKEGLIVMATQ